VGFIDDMKTIDKNLSSTRVAYDNAMKKLTTGTGNILKRVADIKELGAKTSKTLSLNPSEE
jgi:DNA recombination protein RmuC